MVDSASSCRPWQALALPRALRRSERSGIVRCGPQKAPAPVGLAFHAQSPTGAPARLDRLAPPAIPPRGNACGALGRPPPRESPSTRARCSFRLLGREPGLGEARDRQISTGQGSIRRAGAAVARPGAGGLGHRARHPRHRRHAGHGLHPRARDRDLLHDVPACPRGQDRPPAGMRHDALHAARLRGADRDLQGAHRRAPARALARWALLLGGGRVPRRAAPTRPSCRSARIPSRTSTPSCSRSCSTPCGRASR